MTIFNMKYPGFGFKIKITESFPSAFEKYGMESNTMSVKEIDSNTMFHPQISIKCQTLLDGGHYAEAVEKGFKVVKDKLRELTGFEKGSDAFGKGGLFINGASAKNVEEDFNDAVKFLTMAIDNFRNEKAHTSNAVIDSKNKAAQYLNLSSLAMDHLDNASIRSKTF